MPAADRATAELPRRGYNRSEAAEIVGMGLELFDRCVAAGVMPQPRQVPGSSKIVWDIVELNRAFDELPHRGASNSRDSGDAGGREQWLAAQQ